MVNIDLLRKTLNDQNVTMEMAAESLGIDRATLYRRFQQGSKFTVEEVDKLSKLINLSGEQMQHIFFDNKLA